MPEGRCAEGETVRLGFDSLDYIWRTGREDYRRWRRPTNKRPGVRQQGSEELIREPETK